MFIVGFCILFVAPYPISRVRSRGRLLKIFEESAFASDSGNVVPGFNRVSILIYNIAHGRGATAGNWPIVKAGKYDRVIEIGRFIAGRAPDIVVLNEVDFDSTWSGHVGQAALIAETAGYQYRIEQRNLDFRFAYGSWKFGNAILSRHPIVNAELVDFPPVNLIEPVLAGKKRGLLATITIDGRPVRVLAVHVETRSRECRIACAEMMKQSVVGSDKPLVLAGDFNSDLSNRLVAGREATAIDILHAMPELQGVPEQSLARAHTFSSRSPSKTIDWILAPSAWRCVNYEVPRLGLSDHLPVVAEYDMNSSRLAANTSDNDWED